MDELDSGIAVQSADMQTNKQLFYVIQAHQVFNQPVPKFGSITVHNAHQVLKQGHRNLCRTIQQNVGPYNKKHAVKAQDVIAQDATIQGSPARQN